MFYTCEEEKDLLKWSSRAFGQGEAPHEKENYYNFYLFLITLSQLSVIPVYSEASHFKFDIDLQKAINNMPDTMQSLIKGLIGLENFAIHGKFEKEGYTVLPKFVLLHFRHP